MAEAQLCLLFLLIINTGFHWVFLYLIGRQGFKEA